jgi:hypothetical protein
MSKRKQRGAHRRADCVFIGAWIPNGWLPAIDDLVKVEDSDRSKLLRKVIERRLNEKRELAA